MSDIAAIEAAHVEWHGGCQSLRCLPDIRWPCDTAIVLARLHEVEAERDVLAKGSLEHRAMWLAALARLHEVEAERDMLDRTSLIVQGIAHEKHANAITPQQRAVLEAAVAWRDGLNSGTVTHDEQMERLKAHVAAVDALLESER